MIPFSEISAQALDPRRKDLPTLQNSRDDCPKNIVARETTDTLIAVVFSTGCIIGVEAIEVAPRDLEMKTESKLARQKKAALEVAEIMYASLQQFSAEEQERRINEIHKVAAKAGVKPSRKPSTRSATRANPRRSRPASTTR